VSIVQQPANRPRCIFCLTEEGRFTTREHIVPESLSGGDWAILPSGYICDSCQNYFGAKVERKALADYPFAFLRVITGMPTKKRRAPRLDSWEGEIRAGPRPSTLQYKPAHYFAAAWRSGRKTQISLLAQPTQPRFVCRMLVKMGVEFVAANDGPAVHGSSLDAARRFARYGTKQAAWWYVMHTNVESVRSFIEAGTFRDAEDDRIELERLPHQDSPGLFRLRLPFFDLLTPLSPRIALTESADLPEPEYMVFRV
jgi:hypothetical protein